MNDLNQSQNEISFRFASPMDVESCLCFDDTISHEHMQQRIEGYEILVASRGDTIIGYLKLQYLWDTKPFLSLIRIAENERGKGIGRHLLEYTCHFLEMNGFKVLFSSSQVNEEAPQKWHRKMGFAECGLISGLNEGGYGELFFKRYLETKA